MPQSHNWGSLSMCCQRLTEKFSPSGENLASFPGSFPAKEGESLVHFPIFGSTERARELGFTHAAYAMGFTHAAYHFECASPLLH